MLKGGSRNGCTLTSTDSQCQKLVSSSYALGLFVNVNVACMLIVEHIKLSYHLLLCSVYVSHIDIVKYFLKLMLLTCYILLSAVVLRSG